MSRVYAWMAVGLLVTGGVAALTARSSALIDAISGNGLAFWSALVFVLGGSHTCPPSGMATPFFLLFLRLFGRRRAD